MTVTRRAFLRDGSRAIVGLTVAFHLDVDALNDAAAVQAFAPNAFIRIGPDNIVRLWAIRSEMGQGVRTVLPMVLADELEADWQKVVIEQADITPRFKGIRLRTSGSGSAAGTWMPLRKAAAAAREMLISAAAEQWKVEASTCHAESSTVFHPASGRRFTFGQLAGAASRVPVPAKPHLKGANQFHLVGQPVKRRDGNAIITGSAVYGLDVKLPEMLYAVVARCPYLGGKLSYCDSAPAMKISDVKNVIPIRTSFSRGVAVIATNTWAALKGRDALQPVWNKGANAGFDSTVFMRELEQSLSQSG
ncbi:MAG TPA: molybdopterin cofactor-binding domain-containing protein, partial [Candidatus Elarobacter sp.]|nr:molybdopterin cofactor-binding domain-containing protein [Candidatus Elarobacter sp.]